MTEQKIMTVHLRKAMEGVPRYKKAAAAAKFLSKFVKKHMKASEVKMAIPVNDEIFKNGMQNPPVRIRVVCIKDDKNTVKIDVIKTEETK
jgi:large subunit ribosomal protein L31e